ncbi:dihydrolipoamide acetyltransferase family protein [Rhodobacter sp. 24-YEA-8]|uniref:dihydrolipoamide acetyltransferase family protein n=1 Tax=Rhodobacter sp. 24-YEA-8 TaxID=1884310 RepID=UPI0008989A8B|nr:dihydrolipoamide acetyltransferase family protein [Rhodobacter sp. 24-YEA-8]SED16420.1 pyruvate dehydrogenase E2 component (dihydrolipoamide acetyltransferase) [Rhodobacter sp. 24-YEA-8]
MYIVRMPRLGITMESGKVGRWIVAVNSPVKAGDPLFEMETDKSTVEIEAQASGILRKLLVELDQEIAVNTAIAVIAGEDEKIDLAGVDLAGDPEEGTAPAPESAPVAAAQTEPAAAAPDRVRLSPYNRKLAQDLGLEVESLAGLEISEELIRSMAADQTRPAPAGDADYVELTSIQRAMRAHITASWTSIPHFVQILSVDMTNVLKLKGAFGKAGLNDILVKMVADTAADHPMINGRLEGDRVRIGRNVNVSVAVATPKGLVVPVVHAVETLGVQDVNTAIAALAAKAKGPGLAPADTEGGTITFSNLGAYGVEYGTPVINGPQAVLVFAGAIVKTVTVGEDDAIRITPVMRLSIAFDHRFIDGMTAAAFTSDLKKRLESLNPTAFG